jgi:hypothetical protein
MKPLMSAAAIVFMMLLAGHAQSALAGNWQGETSSGTSIELDLSVKAK